MLKKCDSKQQNGSVHREVCRSSMHEGLTISTLQRGPPVSDDGAPAGPLRRAGGRPQNVFRATANRAYEWKMLGVTLGLLYPRPAPQACRRGSSLHPEMRRTRGAPAPPARAPAAGAVWTRPAQRPASSPASHRSARRGPPEADGSAQQATPASGAIDGLEPSPSVVSRVRKKMRRAPKPQRRGSRQRLHPCLLFSLLQHDYHGLLRILNS